jgi:hypothetical protein
VFVLAAVGSGGVVIALHIATCSLLGVGIAAPATLAALVVIVAAALAGAHAWTWSYMERRYAATRDLLCPRCGYHVGATRSVLCPECGAPR